MSEREAILVTGGAGFVGSHFARLAADAGREVIVFDDLSGGSPAKLPPAIQLVVGDIADRALVDRLLSSGRVGAIAHFAAKIQVGESVRDPATYFDVNLVRTLQLLLAARDAGVRSCLFSSTAAVYGNPESVPIPETARREPVNPYGATKLSVELALDAWAVAYGLRWSALRYFNAAGAHPDGTLRESHQPETHLIPLVIDAGLGTAPAIHRSSSRIPPRRCVCSDGGPRAPIWRRSSRTRCARAGPPRPASAEPSSDHTLPRRLDPV